MSVHEQILQLLQAHEVPYALHAHPPLRTVADVEEHLPFVAGRMLKTIAFRKRDGSYVLAGLRGHDRIDYRKLAAAVGVNRRKIASLSPEEVAAQLGFEVGGVAPFALAEEVTVLLDPALSNFEIVFFGSGRKDITIEAKFIDLQHVCGGEMVPLAQDTVGPTNG